MQGKLNFNFYRLIFIFILTLVSACSGAYDNSDDLKKDSKLDQSIVLNHKNLFFNKFFMQNPNCYADSSFLRSSLSGSYYYQWDGKNVISKKSTDLTINSRPYLSSPLVKETIFFANSNICQADNSNFCYNLNNDYAIKMKICNNQHRFHHNSIESVAITSLVHLEKSYRYYKRLTPFDRVQKNTKLIILPKMSVKFIDAYQSVDHHEANDYIKDNLGYVANYNNSPAFFIFPPRQDNLSEDFNLWYSDFAIAHEFGHHIIYSHVDFYTKHNTFFSFLKFFKTNKNFFNLKNYIYGFDNISTDNSTLSDQRQWLAFEEAFADLWAFDATGRHPWKVYFDICLSHSRNPESSFYNDGKKKVLSNENVDYFLASGNIETSSTIYKSCKSTDMSKVHHFASSLSHSLLQMHYLDNTFRPLGYKLVVLADNLAKISRHESKNNIYDISFLSLAHMISPDTFLNANNYSNWWRMNFDQITCRKIKSLFSGMYDYWQRVNYINC